MDESGMGGPRTREGKEMSRKGPKGVKRRFRLKRMLPPGSCHNNAGLKGRRPNKARLSGKNADALWVGRRTVAKVGHIRRLRHVDVRDTAIGNLLAVRCECVEGLVV